MMGRVASLSALGVTMSLLRLVTYNPYTLAVPGRLQMIGDVLRNKEIIFLAGTELRAGAKRSVRLLHHKRFLTDHWGWKQREAYTNKSAGVGIIRGRASESGRDLRAPSEQPGGMRATAMGTASWTPRRKCVGTRSTQVRDQPLGLPRRIRRGHAVRPRAGGAVLHELRR